MSVLLPCNLLQKTLLQKLSYKIIVTVYFIPTTISWYQLICHIWSKCVLMFMLIT